MTISVREIVCSSDYKRIDRIIPLLHLKGDLTTELGGFFIFYANRQKFGYEKGSMWYNSLTVHKMSSCKPSRG